MKIEEGANHVASASKGVSWPVKAGRVFVIFMAPSLGGLVPLGLAVAQPAIATHFGGGDEGRVLARALFSLPSLIIMLGSPLGGYIAERFGYRRVLIAALLIYGIAGSAGLFIDGFIPLLTSRLIVGLASGTAMAIYLPLAAAYFDGQSRAKVLGFATASASIVATGALEFGGRLVDYGGWRAPFAMYLLGFVVCAVAWATVRGPFHSRDSKSASGEASDPGQISVSPFRVAIRFWPVYFVLVMLAIGTFTPSAGGPFLLQADGLTSSTAQGHILSAGIAPSILSATAYGFLRRWFADRHLLTLSAVLMGAGFCVAATVHGYGWLLGTFMVIGLAQGFKSPGVASVLMDEVPPQVRATAAGLVSSGIFLGQFMAPALLEFLERMFAVKGAFLVISIALLGTAAFITLGGLSRMRAHPPPARIYP
jgi:MFS family permease